MKEKYYEELLNIKTTGDQSWDETKKCYHPYEPTPYFALDKLFETYAYDSRQKTQLRLSDEKGLDISKMKDPKFNWEQMREIS